MDELVLEGVVDLRTQATDRDFHDIGVAIEIHVPDQGNDLGAREHLTAAAHQQVQQGELLGGQVDALFAAVGAMTGRVQFEVVDLEDVRDARLFATPQERADPGQQFGKLEWLDQIVVGAGVEAFQLVGQPAACGQHHHRGAAVAADAGEYSPAVDFRQVDIEYDQLVGRLRCHMQAVDTVGCNIDDITTFAQALVEIVGSFKLVLNDQDSHALDNLGEIDKEFSSRGCYRIRQCQCAMSQRAMMNLEVATESRKAICFRALHELIGFLLVVDW